MCGIIAGLAKDNIQTILINGLERLEYRGYDSAGLAVLTDESELNHHRVAGKVNKLKKLAEDKPLSGKLGVAHTRWATHGGPTVNNAHPHIYNNTLALVHNGIIENHEELKQQQSRYRFNSETDTETLLNQIDSHFQAAQDLLNAVNQTLSQIEGLYAFAVIHQQKKELVATRQGCPLVLGEGKAGYFIASDVTALIGVAERFIFLEEGDVVHIDEKGYQIYDGGGAKVKRKSVNSQVKLESLSKQGYRHYMIKEIFEQPSAIERTMAGRLTDKGVSPDVFGNNAAQLFSAIKQIQILACGTSYHAGLVAKYWLEAIVGISTAVEVASEYRYRSPVLLDDTLVITISQSGETADTLAALKDAQKQQKKITTLTICNVAESSLVRASNLAFLTQAGIEIGVASTKAFTTQLTALMMLVICLAQLKKTNKDKVKKLIDDLLSVPHIIAAVLDSAAEIEHLAQHFANKHNALFLGRGVEYPVALEGALKLKEISYIHAEAYPAGELKHGPLALIDDVIPVIAVAPNNALLKKLKSNIAEVRARGGELFVFADSNVYSKESTVNEKGFYVINIAAVDEILSPIVFTVPLQLLAYYVALIKGTDVDQPRNLAKAVTVE